MLFAAISSAGRRLSRRPPLVALGLIAAIVATAYRLFVAGALPLQRLTTDGFSARAIGSGRPAVLLTGTLLTRDPFMLVSICVSLLVTLGSYEVLAGHGRALVVAAVGAVVGPLLVCLALAVGSAAGSSWAAYTMSTVDIGASTIVAAAAGSCAGHVRNRRLSLGLLAFVLAGLGIHHQLADWEHLAVLPVGYVLGRLLSRPPRPASSTAPVSTRRAVAMAAASVIVVVVGWAAAASTMPAPAAVTDAQGHALSPSRLLATTYPSNALNGRRSLLVLLPAGYDSRRARYPVIEFLHGSPGRPTDLIGAGQIGRAAGRAGIPPFIAVIPDGNGPVIRESWYLNLPSQRMGQATGAELRSWVGRTFRVNGSWSYAGLSSGGFGAAYLAMIDRSPVNGICALSSSYGTQNPFLAHQPAAVRQSQAPAMHPSHAARLTLLGVGSNDRANLVATRAYARVLRRAGQHVILRYYPGSHEWSVWRSGFADCIRVLLTANAQAAKAAR